MYLLTFCPYQIWGCVALIKLLLHIHRSFPELFQRGKWPQNSSPAIFQNFSCQIPFKMSEWANSMWEYSRKIWKIHGERVGAPSSSGCSRNFTDVDSNSLLLGSSYVNGNLRKMSRPNFLWHFLEFSFRLMFVITFTQMIRHPQPCHAMIGQLWKWSRSVCTLHSAYF